MVGIRRLLSADAWAASPPASQALYIHREVTEHGAQHRPVGGAVSGGSVAVVIRTASLAVPGSAPLGITVAVQPTWIGVVITPRPYGWSRTRSALGRRCAPLTPNDRQYLASADQLISVSDVTRPRDWMYG